MKRTMRRIEGYVRKEWLLGFDLQVHPFHCFIEPEIGAKAIGVFDLHLI